ncbi:MAG: OmpH family outer membrane protein [Flavobacteriales bacterium]
MKRLVVAILCFLSISAWTQKFAYVDTKYILSHMPEYQSAQEQINKLSNQWQKEIEGKLESASKLETALQAERVLLTEEMKNKRQQDIDERKQEAKDLQKQRFGVEGDLFKKREELIKPIQDQIYEAIQEIASTSSLMVVFDKANHGNMLYTNPKHDISDKVLKKMGLKPGETLGDDEGGSDSGEQEKESSGDDKGSKGAPRDQKGGVSPKGGNSSGKSPGKK